MRRLCRTVALIACGAIAFGASACTFDERRVATGEDRPVVHAVLNAGTLEQSVLVERTLTGRIAVSDDSASSVDDPIVSGGGVPINGARVTITGPDGTVATAIETLVRRTTVAEPAGTGMYVFLNSNPLPSQGGVRPAGFGATNQLPILPGGRYRLRVELPDGRVTTGQTLVPGTPSTSVAPPFDVSTFNRDTDTLRLRWTPVPGARAYALRIESVYGAFFLFTDSAAIDLTGELRNLFAERLPRVFQAGFTQNVYVSAVDTSYFDYYRTRNDPFTGSGIINRLSGGIGLFGSWVPILSRALFVRANDRDPIDGRYFANDGPRGQELLRIWADGRGNGVTEVTGAYRLAGNEQYGLIGTLTGETIRLRAIDNRDTRYTYAVLEGTLRGDTVRVKVTGQIPTNDPGNRTFIKSRPP